MTILHAIGFSLALLTPASASDSAAGVSQEREVRDLEQRWLDALTRRDSDALSRILDPDFLDITWTGELRDRKAALEALANPNRPSGTQRLEDLRVRLEGSVALVTGTNVVSDPRGEVVARVRFTDVFVRRGSQWKALSAQETLVRPPR